MIRRRTPWARSRRASSAVERMQEACNGNVRAPAQQLSWNAMTGAVEQSRTRWVAEAVVVAAAYVVAATLRFVFPFTEHGASWVWLPSGVALAALVLRGRSLWPGIALGGFLSSVLADQTSLWPAFVAAVYAPSEALIATTIIMRRGVLRPPARNSQLGDAPPAGGSGRQRAHGDRRRLERHHSQRRRRHELHAHLGHLLCRRRSGHGGGRAAAAGLDWQPRELPLSGSAD